MTTKTVKIGYIKSNNSIHLILAHLSRRFRCSLKGLGIAGVHVCVRPFVPVTLNKMIESFCVIKYTNEAP